MCWSTAGARTVASGKIQRASIPSSFRNSRAGTASLDEEISLTTSRNPCARAMALACLTKNPVSEGFEMTPTRLMLGPN